MSVSSESELSEENQPRTEESVESEISSEEREVVVVEEEEDIEGEEGSFSKVSEDSRDSSPGDESVDERLKGGADERVKKRKFRMRKCLADKWVCDDNLWRSYMRLYSEKNKKLEREDKFKRRKPAEIPDFPRVASAEEVSVPYTCFPLSGFQEEPKNELPDNLGPDKKIRIWKKMRGNPPVEVPSEFAHPPPKVSRPESGEWPSKWPCANRNLYAELRAREKAKRKKRRDLFPCDSEESSGDPELEDTKWEYAVSKELGHARVPPICPPPRVSTGVDRATGEQQGLVEGDFVIFKMLSKRNPRIHTGVVLRGMRGMHLLELGKSRERRKTWKFCFYQALVALLAKTQIRYKFAWSVNVDYIYDHAWMLFTHMGMINVKTKEHERNKLEDFVVYNYKYNIELQLVQELKDLPLFENCSFDYVEPYLRKQYTMRRPELLDVKTDIGFQKRKDSHRMFVHEETERIERWFDSMPERFKNCIFRTTRFSLAFWKDGPFWYLYNPYRCDEFGFWDDVGAACIVKFCSKQALKRHLMILLVRAYAYEVPKPERPMPDVVVTIEDTGVEREGENDRETRPHEVSGEGGSRKPEETFGEAARLRDKLLLGEDYQNERVKEEEREQEQEEEEESKVFDIQIFNLIYHCCKLHNLRLLEKRGPQPRREPIKRKTIDDCPFDPLDIRDPCTVEMEEGDLKDHIELPTWLKLYSITWSRAVKKKTRKDAVFTMRWHQYTVEESNKLFSLWGELHVTDMMFDKENRGMQTYACYVVCAGMTRIMAPEYWSSKILDVIVMCGDRYYSHSKLEAQYKAGRPEYSHIGCWNKYLMSYFSIGETMFEASVLPAICGRLYAKSSKYLWRSIEQMFLKFKFGILTCESTCLGIFKFCGAYYMCDVNSFGPPVFSYGEGSAYLIRATSFNKFMNVLILTIASPECSNFALNPIVILKVIDVGKSEIPIKRRSDRLGKKTKELCPFDEAKKRHLRNWKIRRMENTRKTFDRTWCRESD